MIADKRARPVSALLRRSVRAERLQAAGGGWAVVGVIGGVTAVKLALAGVLGSTADVPQMLSSARAFAAGLDLFEPANTGSNPAFFLLGHSLLAGLALLLSEATGASFDFAIKLPAILSDFGVALLLRTAPENGNRLALLYMLNPVTFLLSAYHGQLHTVALAGAFFAVWLAERGRFILGSILLALGVSVRQHYVPFIVPIARGTWRRVAACLAVFLTVLLVVNAPLLRSAHPERVLTPASNYGLWGYAALIHHGPRVLELVGLAAPSQIFARIDGALAAYGEGLNWLWTLYFVALAVRRPAEDRWRLALLFLLGIYVVSPGFGIQRLLWAVPFWLMVDVRGALVFSGLASAYLVTSYWQWSLLQKYGIGSITANLDVLTGGDLTVVLLVGVLGFLTWAYSLKAAWRLARA